jgi:hypothetical protein
VPLPFLRRDQSALQAIAETHAPYAPADARALPPRVITGAIEELKGAKPMQRIKNARKAGLPMTLSAIGPTANQLLAYLLEDDELVQAMGEATARVWLNVDASACVGHALARVDVLPARVLGVLFSTQHAAPLDPTEVFDVFAPRLRRDGELRQLITRGFFPGAPSTRSQFSDPRFVDLALELLDSARSDACRLLGVHGGARAVEELRALLDGAKAWDDDAMAALEGIELALPIEELVALLVALLRTSPALSTATPDEIAMSSLGYKISSYGNMLAWHEAALASERVQEIREACMQAHPMPVVG